MSTDRFPASAEEMRRAPLFNQFWYYGIELLPGLFTPGQEHNNIVLTRTLLRHCGLEGQRCLDIGTMEGLVPVLLTRRGAIETVALDGLDCSEQITWVQHYTGSNFKYHPAVMFDQILTLLKDHGRFDVVVLSGVLYHVFNPMHVLGVARSMLRTGGLMIVETAGVQEDNFAMYFNHAGEVYTDPTSFWFPTVPMLDYLLRYFKLAPLDAVWMGKSKAMGKSFSRVATVCRAVDDIVPKKNDPWMATAMQTIDYGPAVRLNSAEDTLRQPVPYERGGASAYRHGDTGTCDLFRTVESTRAVKVAPELIRLGLAQQY